MLKILIPLVFCCALGSANAQVNDSVISLMEHYQYTAALQVIAQSNSDSLPAETLYLKAKALNNLSRFPEAIVCLERLYREDSSGIRVALDLATCYKSVNNPGKAHEIYQETLRRHPGNTYINQLLADSYMNASQYLPACRHYLAACSDDTTTFLLKQTGTCYEKLMMTDSAIHYYQRAMARDPDDYQPFFRLANLYKNRRQYDPGIAVADSFLSRHPDNPDINRLSGYMHYLNQDFIRSVERFQQCLNQGDTTEFADKYMGYSYFKMNDFANAIPCLERIFARDSSDAEMCYVLGLAHDPPKNIRYFQAAINLGMPVVTMLSTVHQDLSLALTKNRQYNDALAALQQALELTPRDPAVLYKLALHYDNWMDDKAMALKYYHEFLSLRKDTGETLIITGTSVVTPGDFEHAGRRVKDIETSFNQAPAMVNDTITNR